MPGQLQGPALVKALSQRDPHLRFIFISGYNDQSGSDDEVSMRAITRLMKPVSQRQLLAAVRDSLYRKAS
jgi:DNA-binding NtrC family response regulator